MAKNKKKVVTCEMCDNCIPIGEGDHLCDECQEIVISEYSPTDEYLKCGGKKYVER